MWNNIIGQEKIKKKIISVYESGKVSHAYLFYGNDGIGKDASAIELAKLMNCENVQTGNEACDKCPSCRNISEFKSEYFNFICALPTGKNEADNPLETLSASDFQLFLEEYNLKAKNHYHKIGLSNANNIRIDSIRHLVSRIYISGNKNKKKVFLISEAEKMKQEAANALLKILEEPPKNSVIILTTSKINSLPKTIIGRCQKMYFEPLTDAQIKEKILTFRKSGHPDFITFEEDEIDLASKLSTGSYTKAVELLTYGINDIRKTAIDYLTSLLRNDYANVVSIARTIPSKTQKEKSKYFLFILNIWFRDLLQNKFSNGTLNLISNKDLSERVTAFNSNFPNTDIFQIILQLEDAEKMLGQNVNPEMILVDLSFKLKHLIR